MRASIARLRALLRTGFPELRARVMRFIRLEIRRLERGGLTGRGRAAAQRLRRLLATLQTQASPRATQRSISLVQVEGSGIPAAIPQAIASGGVLSATAGSESRSAERPGDGRGLQTQRFRYPLLPSPSGLPYWLLLLMLAAIAGLLLLLAGGSRRVPPCSGRGPLPGRGVVELPREIWMVAAVVMLGVLAGLVTVLLIQAALF